MKQMFFADYATIKGFLWQQVLLSVGVTLFVACFVVNPFAVIPMIGVIIPFYGITTLVACDDRKGWERYRMTLPLSRNQTVVGRYVFILALTGASILLGVIIHGVLMLGIPLWNMLPFEDNLFIQLLAGTDASSLFAVAIAPLFIVLLVAGFLFPLSFRFGMSKVVQWIPLVVVVLVLGAGAFLEYTNPQILWGLFGWFQWISMPQNAPGILAVSTGICGLFYAASAALAARLYRTREL